MFLKTVAVTILALIVIIATAISICSPNLIQINIRTPHVTATETSLSEPLVISDLTMIFMLAAVFLITAMFLGILLVIVALRMR